MNVSHNTESRVNHGYEHCDRCDTDYKEGDVTWGILETEDEFGKKDYAAICMICVKEIQG